MSYTLGIDTATSTISIALLEDETPILSTTRYVKNSHAEHIKDIVKSFFELANITPKDIEKCGVVTGPGSFTGIRIGLSFLKGMFLVSNTEFIEVSTIECSANALSLPNGKIAIAMDAKQNHLFLGEFEKINGNIKRISKDKKISLDEFQNDLDNYDFIAYDTMGFHNSTTLDFLAENKKSISLQETYLDRGIAVAKIAFYSKEERCQKIIDIEPNYMQESYAQRNR